MKFEFEIPDMREKAEMQDAEDAVMINSFFESFFGDIAIYKGEDRTERFFMRRYRGRARLDKKSPYVKNLIETSKKAGINLTVGSEIVCASW